MPLLPRPVLRFGIESTLPSEKRFRIYWLNTMLLHVRVFGDRYLPSCDDLAAQVRSLK